MKFYPLFAACSILAVTLVACGDDTSSGAKEEPLQSSSSEEITSSETVPESSSSIVLSTIINEDSTIVDPRDSSTYKVIKIGDQIWMAENMKYSPEDTLCEKGVGDECLYTWSEAMGKGHDYDRKWLAIRDTTGFQGLCPPGWHVPSAKEALTLEKSLRRLLEHGYESEYFCSSVVQEDMLNEDGSRDNYCEAYGAGGLSNGFNMHLIGDRSGFWLVEEDNDPISCTIASAVTFWGGSIWVDDFPNSRKDNLYNLRCVMNADEGEDE